MVLKNQALDGYTLMAKTRLKPEELVRAVEPLLGQSLVIVKGELFGPDVGEAFFAIPTGSMEYAQHAFK